MLVVLMTITLSPEISGHTCIQLLRVLWLYNGNSVQNRVQVFHRNAALQAALRRP